MTKFSLQTRPRLFLLHSAMKFPLLYVPGLEVLGSDVQFQSQGLPAEAEAQHAQCVEQPVHALAD